MPYRSEAQRKWAHTKEGKEALGGEAAVHEWDEATKGKHLPEHVGKSEKLNKNNLQFNEDGSPKPPKTVSAPMKTGQISVKSPKAKKMPSPFSKPSVFFKSEDFKKVKHPSVRKLRDFLEKRMVKKQSS